MRDIAAQPPRPPALLVIISARWEASRVTVHLGQRPPMLHDYGGFPPEAYALDWPARGAPDHGERAIALLRAASFAVDVERTRGFDHGTFVLTMLAWPRADVPVLQVSLRRGLDPAEHLALGRALAPLRDAGALVIGSGNSFHNLPRFFGADARARSESQAFDTWLSDLVTFPYTARESSLAAWEQAPAARACHPREEHLIPLMVAAGAAGDDAGRVWWRGTMGGLTIAAHAFG